MAHLRERVLSQDLKKQLKFWPIVTILGPRQSGKSTFLRDLVFRNAKSSYVSLDRIAVRDSAGRNPEFFLSQFENDPIIIDEAHKVPSLFDEIKATVDEDRRPGRFILTGSVRFSSKIGIRESFTGRSAHLRFDSMVFSETTSEKPSLKLILKYLNKGGMPAVCFLRDESQINRYWTEWLETSCQRDLTELSRGKFNGDLAYRILEATCLLEFPSASEIALKLKVDARRIKTHLEALNSLFLVRPWEPDENSVGKTLYVPFDCGMAQFFGASLRRKWQIWVAHQVLNRSRFQGIKEPQLKYNLTTRGSFADFSFGQGILLFNDQGYPSSHLMKTVVALEKRIKKRKIFVLSMTDQKLSKLTERAMSIPWADLFILDL